MTCLPAGIGNFPGHDSEFRHRYIRTMYDMQNAHDLPAGIGQLPGQGGAP